MTTSQGSAAVGDLLPITVHGPVGAVDLVVPVHAQVMDVAREYARQTGLAAMPLLHDGLGRALSPTADLEDAGIEAGQFLVATSGVHRGADVRSSGAVARIVGDPGPIAFLLVSIAVAAAALGALAAAGQRDTTTGRLAILVLVVAAVAGVIPGGRLSRLRMLAAPAFGAAAAFAWFWEPDPARLPGVLGLAGLAAALTAAVARALAPPVADMLKIWIGAGLTVFVVVAVSAVAGLGSPVVWAVLLVGAMLAARMAPGAVVDVPDDYLIDLERLAVTAWSARSRPSGRRGRIVVSERFVGEVAARGTRLLTAITAAVAVIGTFSAFRLIADADLPIDRIGARVLVFCCGAAVLLVARTYRHPLGRTFLRLGGLGIWAALVPVLAASAVDHPVRAMLVILALSAVVLTCAVAFGRGWRSAWWARRAEVAEGLTGAIALASIFVATGVFREVWEAVAVRN